MTFGFSRYLLGVVLFSLMAIGQLIGRPGLAALSDDDAAALIVPPYQLGARVDDRPLWHVLNAGGEPDMDQLASPPAEGIHYPLDEAELYESEGDSHRLKRLVIE